MKCFKYFEDSFARPAKRSGKKGTSQLDVHSHVWRSVAGVLVVLLVLISGCVYSVGCEVCSPSPTVEGGVFDPLTDSADWQPQDYHDSRAIGKVWYEYGRLTLETHFVGGHLNYSKGEVFVDMRFFPGLEDQIPIDLSGSTLEVTVSVPDGFVGERSRPNGVQLFVKDSEWRCQYGRWVNIMEEGEHQVTLHPTTMPIPGGYTQPNFDPTKIIIIGVKFAIGEGSLATFDGELNIIFFDLSPDIELSPLPRLPMESPPPLDFVVGGNWRIIEYGQDFGATAWFPTGNGVSKHVNFVDAYLDYYRRAGIKSIRVFLLSDGRTLFDEEGHVTGYNEVFRRDVQTLLDLSGENDVEVEFVLFDYQIAGRAMSVEGVSLRGRPGIITNETLRTEFLKDFLIPFLREFGGHPALMGFDIINEPEWIVSQEEGGDWESYDDEEIKAEEPVPRRTLRDFINICIDTIHEEAPGKQTTVGVSCPYIHLVTDLDVDYYALHHYPWMNKTEDYLSLLPMEKPWSLEEYPTNNTTTSITEYLDRVLNAGGSGASLWNLKPEIDSYTMPWTKRNKNLKEIRGWVTTDLEDFPHPLIDELGNLQTTFIYGQSKEHGPSHGAWTIDVAGGTLIASTLGRESKYGLPEALIDVQATVYDDCQVYEVTAPGNLITLGGGDVNTVSRYYEFLEVDGNYALPIGNIYDDYGWAVGIHSRYSENDYQLQGSYGQGSPVIDYAFTTLYLDGDHYVLYIAGITGFTTKAMCKVLAEYQSYDLSGVAVILQFTDNDGDGAFESIDTIENIPSWWSG